MDTDKSPALSPVDIKDFAVEVKVELDDAWPVVCQTKDTEIGNMISNMTDSFDNENSQSSPKPSGSNDWSVTMKRKHLDSSDSESDVSLDIYNFPVNWTTVKIKEFIEKQCGRVRKVSLEVGKGSEPNYVNVVLESSSQRDLALKAFRSIQLDGKQLKAVSKSDEGVKRKSPARDSSVYENIKRLESRRRSNRDQIEMLVDFMERHHDMIGRIQMIPHYKKIAEGLWIEVAKSLNGVEGGAKRTAEKWKKVWIDLKWNIKRKVMKLDTVSEESDLISIDTLSMLEKRVLSLMMNKKALDVKRASKQMFVKIAKHQESVAESPPVVAESALVTEQSPPVANLTPVAKSPLIVEPPVGAESPLVVAESSPVVAELPPVAPNHSDPPFRVISVEPPQTTYQEDITENVPSPASPNHNQPQTKEVLVYARRKYKKKATAFEKAAVDFLFKEQKRLRLEDERDRRLHSRELERERLLHKREVEREKLLHEREMERLRVESLRLEIEKRQNILLRSLLQHLENIKQ